MMSKVRRSRLDVALAERGLVDSREKAQALILAGMVSVDGQKSDKPGRAVASDARIDVQEKLRYVSRGGLKLERALDAFAIDVGDRICADIGTSTGGFADCLLQRGAKRVHCVDTGAGQIDWKLRTDGRIVLHEQTNARFLTMDVLGEMVDLLVCDVSFISVTLLLEPLASVLKPEGDWIILIKPQFEVGRELVGKGGIVREPASHALARSRVSDALSAQHFKTSIIESPLLGAEGNKEFLLHARRL